MIFLIRYEPFKIDLCRYKLYILNRPVDLLRPQLFSFLFNLKYVLLIKNYIVKQYNFCMHHALHLFCFITSFINDMFSTKHLIIAHVTNALYIVFGACIGFSPSEERGRSTVFLYISRSRIEKNIIIYFSLNQGMYKN